jgi:ABC-type multidrug transport system fused ATPase/permease subunit
MTVVREIWSILSPAQKRAGVGLLGWMLVSMIFEMLGIGLMLPALTAMSGSSSMSSSPLVKRILEWLGNPTQTQLIVGGVLTILVIYGLKAVFVLIAAWRQAKYARRLEKSLSERMFSTYMAQPWEFHLQRNSAELIRNMSNIGFFADSVGLILNIVAELFILAGIALVLLFVNPLASIVTAVLAVCSTWFLDRFTKKWSVRWGEVKHEHQALATRAIHQGLGGVKDAKILGRESQFLAQYSEHAGILAAMAERHSFLTVIPRLWNEMLGVSALCVLTLVMLWQGMPRSCLLWVSSRPPRIGCFRQFIESRWLSSHFDMSQKPFIRLFPNWRWTSHRACTFQKSSCTSATRSA